MKADAANLLNLMFRPDETICVSHNKFGYHSLPLATVLKDTIVTLVPTELSCKKRGLKWCQENFEHVPVSDLVLVSLNPIHGFRTDSACTAYRNFLIEMDYGTLDQQLAYINQVGLPYSAIVFSGNKSLHFLVSLDVDLPNEQVWRDFAAWILGIVTMADQNIKNPSRSIRLPGAMRETGRKQKLLEFNGVVSLTSFVAWLAKCPEAKPRQYNRRTVSDTPNPHGLSEWACRQLINGIDFSKGRNHTWFAVACEFARAGYSVEDATTFLEKYFTPERDFPEREWQGVIKAAYKFIYKNSAS